MEKATPALEGTHTNEFIQRKVLGYLYRRQESGMIELNSFWKKCNHEKYIRNTLQALDSTGYIVSVNHRKIGNTEQGILQTLDNVLVTAKITKEGKDYYRKEYRDEIWKYWSLRLGLIILVIPAIYVMLVWFGAIK